jgi:hypothetical protein
VSFKHNPLAIFSGLTGRISDMTNIAEACSTHWAGSGSVGKRIDEATARKRHR